MEEVGAIRFSMRHYFSTYLLWCAEDNAARAGAIEAEHDGRSRFDIKHQGHVLAAILSSAAFLEAMINELYRDAHDGHGVTDDGYIAPMEKSTRDALAELWLGSNEGYNLQALEKYQLLLFVAGHERLPRGEQPYQDAALLVQLRNAIAHYQPENVAADAPAKVGQHLTGKFADNALMRGAGNPWWPSHCLGHGCAQWAWRSALAFSDAVVDTVGVVPNYRRHRAENWQGFAEKPGSTVPHTRHKPSRSVSEKDFLGWLQR
jgi:hypothetical protein